MSKQLHSPLQIAIVTWQFPASERHPAFRRTPFQHALHLGGQARPFCCLSWTSPGDAWRLSPIRIHPRLLA